VSAVKAVLDDAEVDWRGLHDAVARLAQALAAF